LQLIGGVIILQTLPSVTLGLFTRWFHRIGLIAGWIAGMSVGLAMVYMIDNPANKHAHFGSSAFALSKLGLPWNATIYTGLVAVAANVLVAAIGTSIGRAPKITDGTDATVRFDYFADEGDRKLVRSSRRLRSARGIGQSPRRRNR